MTIQGLLQDENQDVTGDGLHIDKACGPVQQVVELMTLFCRMEKLVLHVGVPRKKIKEEKISDVIN